MLGWTNHELDRVVTFRVSCANTRLQCIYFFTRKKKTGCIFAVYDWEKVLLFFMKI